MENEIWKWIPECEGRYQVSNFGRIKSFIKSEGTIITFKINDGGYYSRTIRVKSCKHGKQFKLHRIIGKLFVNNPNDYPMINHKDGDKLNNHYTNLEWTTALGNVTHAINNGLRKRSRLQKLTDEEVRSVREEYDTTLVTMYELAERYGVTPSSINNCLKYHTFFTLDPELRLTFKINKLSKTEFTKFKPYEIGAPKVKTTKKTLEQKLGKTKEELREIIRQYSNGYINLNTFTKDMGLSPTIFKKFLNDIDYCPLHKLDGETFFEYGNNLISDLGRVYDVKRKRLVNRDKINGIKLKQIIMTHFNPIEDEHKFNIIHVNGDESDFKLSNLRRDIKTIKSRLTNFDLLSDKLKSEIRDTYMNSDLTKIGVSIKFGISMSLTNRILVNLRKPYSINRVEIPDEIVNKVRFEYFNENANIATLLIKYGYTKGRLYEVVNNSYKPTTIDEYEKNVLTRKNIKARVAMEKIEQEKEKRKVIAKKKKEETKIRQEKEKNDRKLLTKINRENKIIEEEKMLTSGGRNLSKICQACFETKSTVRDFKKSKNLWDYRANKCKVCDKQNIPFFDPYDLGIDVNDKSNEKFMKIFFEIIEEEKRQKEILEKEKKENMLKNMRKKF